MFLENKYTVLYFKLVHSARDAIKIPNDGNYKHHIIPRSMGGGNSADNLVVFNYKQHRLAHRLLIKMTTGENHIKMSYAYSWFKRSAGSYKTGKDNNFSNQIIIELVRDRMKNNNPMKCPTQRERMRKNNHRNRCIVTPGGTFVSRAEALRFHKFKHWKILYDLMKKYPADYYWK